MFLKSLISLSAISLVNCFPSWYESDMSYTNPSTNSQGLNKNYNYNQPNQQFNQDSYWNAVASDAQKDRTPVEHADPSPSFLKSVYSIMQSLEGSGGEPLKILFFATGPGQQKYECINGNFVNTAVAKLSSEGAVTVDHFFLPTPDANGGRATWKYIQDGSTVTAKAQVLLKAPDPTKDIDWVLLDTTSTTPGFFGKVKHVIRANTCKGVNPTPGAPKCSGGPPIMVDYIAQYVYLA